MKTRLKAFKLLILFQFAWIFYANAQMMDPVKWTFSSNTLDNGNVELLFTAKIDAGWHLYSQFIPENGPVPTSFAINKTSDFELVGKVVEPKPHEEFDANFDMTLKYFDKKATFKQVIKPLSAKPFTINGQLEFMCCNDQMCLPPNMVEFSFNIKPVVQTADDITNTTVNETETKQSDTAAIALTNDTATKDTSKNIEKVVNNEIISDETEKYKDMSLLWFFFVALGAGFLAVLTPCIYPMIPMTVSYFMHDKKNKRKALMQALVFGISIIVIYILIGSLVAIFLGERFTNFVSTHWIPNIFFFILFVVFAASFLGMFEIVLPSWLVNKSDKQVEKGGMGGAFFMALTLVIVSFSCTAPIAGSILAFSAQGMVIKPIIGMLGYSLAFAIPFTIFAIIPSWLHSLPKSGGWLNAVKVVIGFVELALAFKFLSVADQTHHWGLLDREIYIALWIVIFSLMGFYLLGKLKFSHDSEMKFLSVPRLGFAIIVFTFVIYLFPGMFGAPLRALAGWLPPQTTHDFDLQHIIRENAYMIKDDLAANPVVQSENNSNSLCEKPKYADQLHLPHGLRGYFDYDQALKCAKATNKPIFIDFTGHGCVNCREMEARVWSDNRVLSILREQYVLLALYVDDHKIKLSEDEWITSTYDGKVKKTLGAKNWDFQKSRFNANAQPYYCLLDTNGELLVMPRAYDLDIEEFVSFLNKGLEEFKKRAIK